MRTFDPAFRTWLAAGLAVVVFVHLPPGRATTHRGTCLLFSPQAAAGEVTPAAPEPDPEAADQTAFFEDAWAEAVSVLKEEVGAEAVESGRFSIPRREISVHEFTGACEGQDRPVWVFHFTSDACVLMSCQVDSLGTIDPQRARHVIATFSYIALIDCPSRTQPPFRFDTPAVVLYPPLQAGPGEESVSSAGEPPLHNAVRRNVAYRYAKRVAAGGYIHPAATSEEEASIALAMLESSLSGSSLFHEALVRRSLRVLHRTPYGPAVPALRQVDEDGRYHATDELWLAENLAGRPEEEQIEVCIEAALRKRADGTVHPYGPHNRALWGNWPSIFSRRIVERWDELDERARRTFLAQAEQHGGREIIARKMARGDSVVSRVYANLALFLETGERPYIKRCVEEIPVWTDFYASEPSDLGPWGHVYVKLCHSFGGKRPMPEEVAALLRKAWSARPQVDGQHYSPSGFLSLMARKLVQAGGEENIRLALEMIAESDRLARYDLENPMWVLSWGSAAVWDTGLRDALTASQEPFLADLMLENLKALSPELRGYSWLTWALAEKGDKRIAPLLEEGLSALDAEREKPVDTGHITDADEEFLEEYVARIKEARGRVIEFAKKRIRITLFVMDFALSPDRIGLVETLSDDFVWDTEWLIGEMLARNYSKEQVRSFLARPYSDAVTLAIYRALRSKRGYGLM